MNSLTNIAIKTIPLISIFMFSLVIEAKPSAKEDKKVDVKCFVELVGGGETISFWSISAKKAANLSKSITGHKISVPNSKQKVKIYKAHECVFLKDDFAGSRAKIVDAKTAR